MGRFGLEVRFSVVAFVQQFFEKGISGREVRALLRGTVCHNRPLVLTECILAPQMPIHFMYSHFVSFALLCRSWSPTLPRCLTHSVSFCVSKHISESFCFSNFHEFSVSIHSLSSRDSSRADCSGTGMVFTQLSGLRHIPVNRNRGCRKMP